MANTQLNQHSSDVELPSFIRINPSFVEHLVFLFLHLLDNCCNSLLFNRADSVSEFSAI